jgi:hypothetical protein
MWGGNPLWTREKKEIIKRYCADGIAEHRKE